MIQELILNKKESSPKFTKVFDHLIAFIHEVDEHLRDMHCWVKWPSIKGYHLSGRYDGTYYRRVVSINLDLGVKGTADIQVIETDKGFDVEVEFISSTGFAVCGAVNSFQFACAALMVF